MINSLKHSFYLFLFMLLSFSCSSTYGSKEENSEAPNKMKELLVKDASGDEVSRIKEKEMNNASFSVLYKPLAYVISQGEDITPTKDNISKYRNQYDGLIYFDIRIDHKDAQGDILKYLADNGKEYEDFIKYCSFGIAKDLVIVTENGDTSYCAHCHFERSYGLLPGLSFLSSFKRLPDFSNGLTFIINDKLFNRGPIKFHFTKEELEEPELP